MRFTITFRVSPPGVFGVAQPYTTVIPPTSRSTPLGVIFDTHEYKVIDKSNEFSVYRNEHEKVDIPLKLGDIAARIVDNILTMEVDAEDYQIAYDKACRVVEILLQHLAISQGCLFKTGAVTIRDCTGTYPPPTTIPLGGLRIYDLSKLKTDIKELQGYHALSDERLSRAIEYFEHALFLFEIAQGLSFSSKGHSGLCMSEAFLNLWKCATSIVGDPTIPKDGHQKRCRELGLTDAQETSLRQIRRLRNDHDVAHYSLSTRSKQIVEREFGNALRTVATLVQHYRRHLSKPASNSESVNEIPQ